MRRDGEMGWVGKQAKGPEVNNRGGEQSNRSRAGDEEEMARVGRFATPQDEMAVWADNELLRADSARSCKAQYRRANERADRTQTDPITKRDKMKQNKTHPHIARSPRNSSTNGQDLPEIGMSSPQR